MTSNARSHRRGLKEAFKTILPRRRDDRDVHSHIEPHRSTNTTTVQRERNQSLALLPTLSSLSSLPDFDSSSFSLGRYSVAALSQHNLIPPRVWAADYSQDTIIPYISSAPSLSEYDIDDAYQYQSQLGQLAKTCSVEPDWYPKEPVQESKPFPSPSPSRSTYVSSQESLFSRTTSNQNVTPETIHFQSPLSQIARACNVPSVYRYGTSLQASLATLQSSLRSASTLRLQRSPRDLPTILESPPVSKPKRIISIGSAPPLPVIVPEHASVQERRNVSSEYPVVTADPAPAATHLFQPPRPVLQNSRDAELDAGLSSINHFSSFCVLDASSPSCPVTATSQDLRLVFDIGEDFCLDTVGIDGASMDTVTGQDADGNVVIHLVIYSRLINPSSGRSRFILASLLDITSFITGTASVPDLETISEESFAEEEINTPPRLHAHCSSRYELPPSSLAGQENVVGYAPRTPLRSKESDIWLDIASEETRRTRSIRSTPSTPRSRSSATTSSAKSIDDILDQFLASLQELYSEFFLLGKSPLDEDTYEICNVSSKMYDSREYIEGHLTRTSASDRAHLERRLTQGEPFHVRVRWGIVGELKLLYCIPLFGRSNVTWVCFLVEEGKWAGMPTWE